VCNFSGVQSCAKLIFDDLSAQFYATSRTGKIVDFHLEKSWTFIWKNRGLSFGKIVDFHLEKSWTFIWIFHLVLAEFSKREAIIDQFQFFSVFHFLNIFNVQNFVQMCKKFCNVCF
jgi:hypothetical protein